MLDLRKFENQLKRIQQWVQKSDGWRQKKTEIITATEVPTISNCNPYQTIQTLYQNKCHPELVEQFSNDSTKWGEKYEPIALKCFQQRHANVRSIIDLGLAVHPVRNYLGASPDGLVVIDVDGRSELWLIEIKCPHQRQINQTIPYNYWLQIQTQLYVWTPLLTQLGYVLKGCIYCENEFQEIDSEQFDDVSLNNQKGIDTSNNQTSYYVLNQMWEQPIIFDEKFYQTQIIPQIELFMSYLQPKSTRKRKHTSTLSTKSTKKSKLDTNPKSKLSSNSDAMTLYLDYLEQKHMVTQKQYRNYVNHNQLRDWLELYGQSKGLIPSISNSNQFATYLSQQTEGFKIRVYQYIQIHLDTHDYVWIQPIVVPNEPHLDIVKSNPRGLVYTNFQQTLKSMRSEIPVIMDGCLYNPTSKTFANYHLLVKLNYLESLFPIAYQKICDSGVDYDESHYVCIQLRYSRLKLCAKNLYLLNVGSQKQYKLEQAHLSQVLDFYQPTQPSLIMSRKSTSSSKGVITDHVNSLNSFGVIDFVERDVEVVEDLYAVTEWFQELQMKGHQWTIDPPSRLELYPNLKDTNSSQWSSYERELGVRNRDLTQLWQVGVGERTRLWETGSKIRRWDQLDVSQLKVNTHMKNIIHNLIQSQLTNQPINLKPISDQLCQLQSNIEFFLDFEFVNDIVDDFQTFPVSRVGQYIYMIGCVCVNHLTNQTSYRNYLINRLDSTQEQTMMTQFLDELDELNGYGDDIQIYHCGGAEKTQLTTYLTHQHQMGQTIISHDRVKKLKMVDISELLKNFETTIPNCYAYGLKELAKTFYDNGWIQTIWPNDLNGEDAMMGAIQAEQRCQQGQYQALYQVPLMQPLIEYNYVDCKVMEEIVSYLRSNK